MLKGPRSHPRAATTGGLVALLIWSATVAVARSLAESLGTLTAASLATGLGGALALLLAWTRGRPPGAMLRLPRRYLLACGGLFVLYEVCVLAALGWSANRSVAILAGLANYLWPMLTVVLSVPILGRRTGPWLGVGAVLAVGGTATALLWGSEVDAAEISRAGAGVLVPLALAGVGAAAWGLYSNLVRGWGRPEAGAVPLFLLAASAALAAMRCFRPERTVWSIQAAAELTFLAGLQSAAAYVLWERGMRRGNHLLLSLTSYFIPVASVATACAYLKVPPTVGLLLGAGLVTAGALICRGSLSEPPPTGKG